MKKYEILKKVVELGVSWSAGTVISTAAMAFVPANATKMMRAQFRIGGFFMGGLAGKHTGSFAVQQLEELVDTVASLRNK